MAEYLVNLDRFFRGPLDLLLHLVREKEIEISHLSLASVADDYSRYVESLRDLDVNEVGEYLVIAATLMLIKSRMLLPREVVDVQEDLGPDDELILQLIEYKRFRDAADDLGLRAQEREELFERGKFDDIEEVEEVVIESVSPWDLLSAFGKLLRKREIERPHTVQTKERSLKDHVLEVIDHLRDVGGRATFREVVLAHAVDRLQFVGCFFAILELGRQGVVRAVQGRPFEEIYLELLLDDYDEALERVLFALEVRYEEADDGMMDQPASEEVLEEPTGSSEESEERGSASDESSSGRPVLEQEPH